MILKKIKKQPSEDKDYDIDFSPWLIPMDDSLDEMDVFVECLDDPSNQSLEVYDFNFTEETLKIWVKGGTDGFVYKITIKAQTAGRRLDESEILFIVGEI